MSEDAFNLENLSYHLEIYNIYANFITIITIITAIIALWIIFKHTSKFLATYKYLLLAYIFVQIAFNAYILVFKMIFILPYPIIIVITPFSQTNVPLMAVLTVFEFVCILINADLLLCMFIERYYSMTKRVVQHSFLSQALTYSAIAITNFMVALTYIVAQIPGGHLHFEDDARKFILEKLDEPEKLLKLPYPIVDDIFARITPYGIPYFASLILFIITRGIGYLYYSYMNINCLSTLKNNNNSTLRKHNANAVKNLIIQLILLFTIGFIPPSLSLLLLATHMLTYKIYLYVQCIFLLYSLIDIICTLVIIRPYRNAIIKWFPIWMKRKLFCCRKGVGQQPEKSFISIKYQTTTKTAGVHKMSVF